MDIKEDGSPEIIDWDLCIAPINLKMMGFLRWLAEGCWKAQPESLGAEKSP